MKRKIAGILLGIVMINSALFALIDLDSENVNAYTPHAPIAINGNADFASQAAAESWPGDGSQGNPYIIEGYDIDASTAIGIEIRNTDVDFVIRDCYIHDGGSSFMGIYLLYLSNGTIEHCNITNNDNGIFFYTVTDSVIFNNTIHSNAWNGIFFQECTSNKVHNNSVYSNDSEGIDLVDSSADTVFNNTIYSNVWNGIRTFRCSGEILCNNTIMNNYDGIVLSISSNHVIHNNTFLNDGIYIRPDPLVYWNTHAIENNTANGRPIYYYKNVNDITVPQDAIQVILANCDRFTIDNLNASGTSVGVEMGFSDGTRISNSTISSNHLNGIYLYICNNNTIINNSIFKNGMEAVREAVIIDASSNNLITGNMVHNNYKTGIYLHSDSHYNNIENNYIYDNLGHGICVHANSVSDIIDNNTVYGNTQNGVHISQSSSITVRRNTIYDNSNDGIYVMTSSNIGIYNNTVYSNDHTGINMSSTQNNMIYHNNIIKNALQAYDGSNNGNQWDNGYPSGGNYWSDFDEPSEGAYDDYKGLDQNVLGRDNIVDNGTVGGGGKNPYIIDSDSQDVFPLISPIGNLTFLYEGWNLISIPFIQPDTDLSKVLESIKGSFDTVEWYNTSDDSDYWKINNTNKLDIQNDLDNIDHTKGFWIHITEPGGVLFEYSGVQPTSNQTITLQPGWNMVGYPSIKNYNRTVGLNNLTFGTHVDSIWTYNASSQGWKEMGEFDFFGVGRGYWIHAKTKCVWEVPI